MRSSNAQPLKLLPLQGPPVATLEATPGSTLVLGRSVTCDVQLSDPSVSRRHATLADVGGTWLVTDLHSRAGVTINGTPIAPDTPTPLSDLDLLSIGPWTFRAQVGASAGTTRLTLRGSPGVLAAGERVDAVPERELRSLARRRLDLLIDCAAQIYAATSEEPLARAVAQAAREGTGFPRAAVFRLVGDEIELLATAGDFQLAERPFSRTLIEAAGSGQVARLSHDGPINHGESIARLGIQAAICAPIALGDAVDAYLYLDDRRHDAIVEPDAGAFCQALCRIGGLALANQRRAALERLNAEIMRDVSAAAEARRLLMPAAEGRCRSVGYSVRMKPGRFVAGDLFNILPLEGRRVGVYLGDVAGKGVGAAMLMATTQTMLNAALRSTASPAAALDEIGPELAPMLPGGRFISLWVAVIEPDGRTVRFVDAGHGHWLVRSSRDASPTPLQTVGGLPLGVDPDAPYHDETLMLGEGGRIVLLSDGVVEQRSRGGEEFGLARTIAALEPCNAAAEDVERLFREVQAHAGADALDDDVTVASLALDSA
ncbi:MAG: SpoIIE family protein phosphatase [Planctomycetota bacterium]|nr:SpoIIE family protein phosphatase [Planctomycetota bacterium]